MQPNQYYSTQPSNRIARVRRWVVLVIVLLLVGWLSLFIYHQIVFRVSKTDPNMNRVAASSAFIKIYFNKPIASRGLSLSYSSKFVEKYTIGDKEIDLTLPTSGLVVGKRYTITINYVASTGGKVIRNKELRFTAKDIPVSKLSKAQQSALISRQDQYPYASQNINYVGFDNLVKAGLSANQLATVQQDLFGYSIQVNQKFWTMTLVQNSLSVKIHDSSTGNLNDTYAFRVKLGPDTFSVVALSDPINNQLQLQLFDPNNSLVYDSNSAHD